MAHCNHLEAAVGAEEGLDLLGREVDAVAAVGLSQHHGVGDGRRVDIGDGEVEGEDAVDIFGAVHPVEDVASRLGEEQPVEVVVSQVATSALSSTGIRSGVPKMG